MVSTIPLIFLDKSTVLIVLWDKQKEPLISCQFELLVIRKESEHNNLYFNVLISLVYESGQEKNNSEVDEMKY